MSSSEFKTDQKIELSQTIPEDAVNANKTLLHGTKLSKRLYKCIKDFSTCTKNNYGNCPRTYQRCTLKVFDEDIQGRQADDSDTNLSVEKKEESTTETVLINEGNISDVSKQNVTSQTEGSKQDDQVMEAYPDMDLYDPLSK